MPIPSITDGLTRVLLSHTALDGTLVIGMTRPILGSAALKNLGDFLQRALNLSDVPDKPTARTNLGLGTAATHNVGPHMTKGPGQPNEVVLFRHLGGAAYVDVADILAQVPTPPEKFIDLTDTPNGYGGSAGLGPLLWTTNEGIAYTNSGSYHLLWSGTGIGVTGRISAAGGYDGAVVSGSIYQDQPLSPIFNGIIAAGTGHDPTPDYNFYKAVTNSIPSNVGGIQKFKVDQTGSVFSTNASIGAADYAEWLEGTADIAPGTSVVIDAGGVRPFDPGTDAPDAIIGVTRPRDTRNALIGNAAEEHWSRMYLTDDFGAPIWAQVTEFAPVNGNPNITQTATYRVWAVNPDYDPSRPYVPRSLRPEWSLIGMLGQIPVRAGQGVHPNWIKLRSISAQADLYLVIR